MKRYSYTYMKCRVQSSQSWEPSYPQPSYPHHGNPPTRTRHSWPTRCLRARQRVSIEKVACSSAPTGASAILRCIIRPTRLFTTWHQLRCSQGVTNCPIPPKSSESPQASCSRALHHTALIAVIPVTVLVLRVLAGDVPPRGHKSRNQYGPPRSS